MIAHLGDQDDPQKAGIDNVSPVCQFGLFRLLKK